ncbi:MAG: hypothetical protein HYR88_10045 [Verrucomicrobia bacterium]|nr:hypothetical protein [Verrucomicrobiota bacterium]
MWWHGEGAQTAEGLGADRAEVAARSPSVSPDASATGEGADAPAEGSYVTQELPKIPRKPKQAPPLIATPVLNPTPQPGIAPNAPVPPPPSPPIASHATQAPQRENPTPVASTSRTAPALTRAPAPLPAPVVAAPQPTAPPQTTFPALTLQGIYYRPTRPAAVINSRTVYVGDRISNTKVLAIDRHEVTVQWNNQVRVLAFQ